MDNVKKKKLVRKKLKKEGGRMLIVDLGGVHVKKFDKIKKSLGLNSSDVVRHFIDNY